jgi:hypothetical protein
MPAEIENIDLNLETQVQRNLKTSGQLGPMIKFKPSNVLSFPATPMPRMHELYLTISCGPTGIPGDGRCLFRSVAHGACLRSGQSTPD